MKKIVTILFLNAIISTVNAQESPFQKGTNVISAGIGIGSSIGSGYTNSTQSPGISVQFEHGVWDIGGPGVISLGGYAGIKSFKYDYGTTGYHYPEGYYNYSITQKWSYTVIGVRSAYHYNGINNDKFDLYGGLMLSYNILSYSYSDNDPYYDDSFYNTGSYGSAVGFTAYAGGRYFFTERIGAYLELGYGVAYLNIGAAFKF